MNAATAAAPRVYWPVQWRRNRGVNGLIIVVAALLALYAYLFPGLISVSGVSKFSQSWLPLALVSMAQAILTEASLSFTGLGLDPSTPSWGTMLNDGRDYLLSAWWISTMPGVAIGFTVMGVLMLGEGMREVLDPRSPT